VNPAAEGSEPSDHPNASVTRDGMGAVCKTVASARQVRFLRLALKALVVQRMARRIPNPQAAGSTPAGSAARDSPGERRSAKPPDGFDSRRVSTARGPEDRTALS
jgi:hypothetical protein